MAKVDRSPTVQQTVVRIGAPHHMLRDLYARLLRAPWRLLLVLFFAAYLTSNTFFACLYLAGGDSINGAEPGNFGQAFFFSIQTLSTIGYGAMSPKGLWGNFVVALEAATGLLAVALVTGVVFAKFARPTAGVIFSDQAIIGKRNGQPCLMLRLANSRGNDIVQATVHLTALFDDVTKEGQRLRRLYDLKVQRDTTPVFVMSWLVIHPIDDDSPLHGMSQAELERGDVRIIVNMTGIDGTFMQTIYAYKMYFARDVLFDAEFVDVIRPLSATSLELDLSKFHEVVRR